MAAGRPTRPTVILQIGDSHSANDAFSTRMREHFQQRFGAAGRGLLPAGIPFRTYRPDGATVSLKGDWRQVNWFNPPAPGLYGITGVRVTSADATATMTLIAPDDVSMDRALIEVMRKPKGGTLELITDTGRRFAAPTAAQTETGEILEFALPPATHRLDLKPLGDGEVALLGWGYAQNRSGIVYENHGTIGATIHVLEQLDTGTLHQEMSVLHPALILIAFGTNEGFKSELDGDAYRQAYADQIRRLRVAAPGAAIVVIGPPDSARKTAAPVGPVCGKVAATPGRNQTTEPTMVWETPPHLETVRDAQRRVAGDEGLFFWDWAAAMGGRCSMLRFVQHDPPLALDDHIHLRTAGYRQTADILFDTMMKAYERYRAAGR